MGAMRAASLVVAVARSCQTEQGEPDHVLGWVCVCCRCRARARVQVITKLKGDLKTVAERNARLLRKMTEMQLLLTNASRQGLVTPKVRTGRQL